MKQLFFASTLALLLAACNSGNRGNNPYDDGLADNPAAVQDTGDVTDANAVNWDDASAGEFVSTAASSGMMEVELGRLAQERGSSPAVKEFGQMMVRDHTKAGQELQTIADSVRMAVPQTMQDMHQQKIDELQQLSGAEFDEAYIKAMVEAHRKDIEKFEEAQDRLMDQPLANWVRNTLPVLRGHYDRIQEIQQTAQN